MRRSRGSRSGLRGATTSAIAAGFAGAGLGLALLGIAWWPRGYLTRDPRYRHLLAGTLNGIAALAFGAAAVGLLTLSINTAVHYGSGGVGWYLSGGLVSLGAAAATLAAAWRHLRVLRPWNHVLAEPQV